jgi:hypothetical protein
MRGLHEREFVKTWRVRKNAKYDWFERRWACAKRRVSMLDRDQHTAKAGERHAVTVSIRSRVSALDDIVQETGDDLIP